MNHHDPHPFTEPKNARTKYDHPNAPGVKLVPEPGLLPNARGGIRRPAINHILAKTSFDWGITSLSTLGNLAFASGGTLYSYRDWAVPLGLIEDVGRLAKMHSPKIKEPFFFGRKSMDQGFGKQKTRTPLEKPDRFGLFPGSRFLTTRGFLITPHDFFVTEMAAWLARVFLENGITAVLYSEDCLRERFGWYSPRKVPANPCFCTEVPDGLLHFEGMIVRLEFQFTAKTEDYAHKCAAAYGEPVVYVVVNKTIYDTLKNLTPKPDNLFVVNLWQDQEVGELIKQLREFALQPPHAFNQIADHYSLPGFAYGTINPAFVPDFIQQTALGQSGRRMLYEPSKSPQEHMEDDRTRAEMAHQAWIHFYAKSEAKSAEAQEALLKAKEDEAWEAVAEEVKRQVEQDKRPWSEQ